DFSGSSIVYADPSTTTPGGVGVGTRTPFPNNQIPTSRLDPMTVRLLSFFPDPNYKDPNPTVRNNYLVSEKNNDRLNSYNLKGDGNISQSNTVTGRFS